MNIANAGNCFAKCRFGEDHDLEHWLWMNSWIIYRFLIAFSLVSGVAIRYSCTPTMSAHLRWLAVQNGSAAMEPLQHLFVAPLIYFLGSFGNSRRGARRLTRRDEYGGNKRQTERCQLNCVFMQHYFHPQKLVIGINYLTGADGDDSHDLAVSIEFASGRHERETAGERMNMCSPCMQEKTDLGDKSCDTLCRKQMCRCLCCPFTEMGVISSPKPYGASPSLSETSSPLPACHAGKCILFWDSWWGASIHGFAAPLFSFGKGLVCQLVRWRSSFVKGALLQRARDDGMS